MDGEVMIECLYYGWCFGSDGVCKYMFSLIGFELYDLVKVKVCCYLVYEVYGVIYVFIVDDLCFIGVLDVLVL